MVAAEREDGAAPELGPLLTDELLLEQEPGSDRADAQHDERNQHGPGALVRLVIVAVAIFMFGQRLVVGLDLSFAGVVVQRVIVAVGVIVMTPAGVAVEGEESQAPAVEGG